MIYFDIALVIMCLLSLKFNRQNKEINWMTVKQTTSIKGIFIIMVFLSHIRGYITSVNTADIWHNELMGRIGQRMVVYFLVCSGYGVMESIKKKGKIYINAIPHRRVLNLLLKFDIAVCIYILIDIFMNGGNCSYSIRDILLSFVGWESVGNSNWYVFAIIYAYIATWIAFKCAKEYNKCIVITFLLSITYIVVLRISNKGTWWYDTILAYPLGMCVSMYSKKLQSLFSQKILYILSLLLTLCGAFISATNILVQIMQMLLFGMAIILLTMQISFENIFLDWCGKNLFAIYILQRIPMILLKEWGLADGNKYIYTIVCFIGCCLLAFLFNILTKRLYFPDGLRGSNTPK